MALTHSPRIVTDGLVLCLDAGNTKSYPGSGTAWNDLSGSGNWSIKFTSFEYTLKMHHYLWDYPVPWDKKLDNFRTGGFPASLLRGRLTAIRRNYRRAGRQCKTPGK